MATLDYDFTPGAGAEVGWHLRDHLGSTYAIIAAPVTTVPFGDPLKLGQRILWTGHYEAFGRPDSLRPVCPGFFPNPIQYTGYYSDGDIFEHYYAKARYYDPYTGRFLSRDPADFDPESFPGAINRYTYTANNPLRYVDPDGEFFFLPLLLAGVELWGMSAMTAIVVDAVVAGGIEYLMNPDGGLGGVLLAMSQQLIADTLLFGYATALSAIRGASSLHFGSSLNTFQKPGLAKGLQYLEIFNSYLTWGQQTVLNLYGASDKWGREWLSQTDHHGWGGFVFSSVTMFSYGNAVALELVFATAGLVLSVDDFMQHLAQVIRNDPTIHSPIHNH